MEAGTAEIGDGRIHPHLDGDVLGDCEDVETEGEGDVRGLTVAANRVDPADVVATVSVLTTAMGRVRVRGAKSVPKNWRFWRGLRGAGGWSRGGLVGYPFGAPIWEGRVSNLSRR